MNQETTAPVTPAAEAITCSMCGHVFDPSRHVACQACPLQSGCQLVCCPACGFEMVNPNRSAAVRWIKRLLQKMD